MGMDAGGVDVVAFQHSFKPYTMPAADTRMHAPARIAYDGYADEGVEDGTDSPRGDAPTRYSRKDKSLGLLCEKFLRLYDTAYEATISLDEAAARLSVERRRIYDIVNVLESVEVVKRKQKNSYSWCGLGKLPITLARIKEEALATAAAEAGNDGDSQGTASAGSGGLKSTERKEKSLGLLSHKFIQMFLISETSIVSMEEAAQRLLGDAEDEVRIKTKIRRLYDIANILSSLRLIEKTHLSESRKPAFRWMHTEDSAPGTAAADDHKRRWQLQHGDTCTSTPRAGCSAGTAAGVAGSKRAGDAPGAGRRVVTKVTRHDGPGRQAPEQASGELVHAVVPGGGFVPHMLGAGALQPDGTLAASHAAVAEGSMPAGPMAPPPPADLLQVPQLPLAMQPEVFAAAGGHHHYWNLVSCWPAAAAAAAANMPLVLPPVMPHGLSPAVLAEQQRAVAQHLAAAARAGIMPSPEGFTPAGLPGMLPGMPPGMVGAAPGESPMQVPPGMCLLPPGASPFMHPAFSQQHLAAAMVNGAAMPLMPSPAPKQAEQEAAATEGGNAAAERESSEGALSPRASGPKPIQCKPRRLVSGSLPSFLSEQLGLKGMQQQQQGYNHNQQQQGYNYNGGLAAEPAGAAPQLQEGGVLRAPAGEAGA